MEKLRILLVDDIGAELRNYKWIPSELASVRYARSPEDGLELIWDFQPDCVLLNENLRNCGARQFLKELRQVDGIPPRIYFLSRANLEWAEDEERAAPKRFSRRKYADEEGVRERIGDVLLRCGLVPASMNYIIAAESLFRTTWIYQTEGPNHQIRLEQEIYPLVQSAVQAAGTACNRDSIRKSLQNAIEILYNRDADAELRDLYFMEVTEKYKVYPTVKEFLLTFARKYPTACEKDR